MRPKHCILILTAILLASCGKDVIDIDDNLMPLAYGPGYLFDAEQLPQLHIAISESEWNRLLEEYDKDAHNHEYIRCDKVTLSREDATLSTADAGLRLRGQTSRRRPEGSSGQKHKSLSTNWHHFHFGLNFRKFSPSGALADVRRINLKYAKEDPSYIREHFCFDVLSQYGVWTAPKTSWCRLQLQIGKYPAAYYGVYLMQESIDMQYVKNRPQFGSEQGFLWKCAWGANLRDRDDWRFHLDDNSSNTYAYELKEDDGEVFGQAKAQLKDFIYKLNSLSGSDFYNWIQQVCDIDLLLKTYAANVALGHWDDYWNDMNNFYLYFNSRDPEHYKVYMICFDYDNTLGTSHRCGVQTDSGRHDPYHWGLEECTLISKILQVSDFKARYTSYLQDFASENNPYTGVLQSAGRIRSWQQKLSPYISNDTGEDMVIKDRPASWGNHPEYRLLENSNNWFRIKAESISYYLQ